MVTPDEILRRTGFAFNLRTQERIHWDKHQGSKLTSINAPKGTYKRQIQERKYCPKPADTRTDSWNRWPIPSNTLDWSKYISAVSLSTFSIIKWTKWRLSWIELSLTAEVFSEAIKLDRTSYKRLAMNSEFSIAKGLKLSIPSPSFLFLHNNLMLPLVNRWGIFLFFNQWLNISASRGTNTGDYLKYTSEGNNLSVESYLRRPVSALPRFSPQPLRTQLLQPSQSEGSWLNRYRTEQDSIPENKAEKPHRWLRL